METEEVKPKKELIINSQEDTLREIGRLVAGGYYDYQETRIASANRLRSIVRARVEGIDRNTPEKKKDEKSHDNKYNDANIATSLDNLMEEGKISEAESKYLKNTLELLKESKKLEVKYQKAMMDYVITEPIWNSFLKDIKGISGVLGANMIKEFGYCEKSPHISSLWKLCGYHVVDGKSVKRKKGVKLDFNLKLRTMCYKITDSFIKQRTPLYREIYDKEKDRQKQLVENKAPNAPESLMHADLRARRKMIKIFLSHYWLHARKIKGLEISEPYAIAKLGHTHYI